MKNLGKGSILIAVLFSVIISNSAFAWNDKVTQKALTEEAVKLVKNAWFAPYLQNNFGFKDDVDEKLPYQNKQETILDILKEGAKEEDAWPDKFDPETARSMNHFLSPIYNMGLSQGEKCIIPFIWCFQLEGESALAWARGDSGSNEYSWFEARYHYKLAFEAESATDRDRELAHTFRSLGQIMHLVQDMAVPAHTRNDSMPGHTTFKGINGIDPTMWYGNNLEIYLERNPSLVGVSCADPADVRIPNFNHLSTEDPTTELSYFWDADVYLGNNFGNAFDNDIGLAEYSSANFLSTGRMFEESTEFPHPNKGDTDPIDWSNPEPRRAEDNKYDQKIYFWKKNEGYRLAVAGILTKDCEDLFPEHEIWEKTTQLDENCHKDYAERLIPKAVGYSAGVLNYFFRGALEISAPVDYLYAIIDGGFGPSQDPVQPQQFTKIKANIKNISEYQEVPETMGAGELWAIAKYNPSYGSDPYLRRGDSLLTAGSGPAQYSVSAKITIDGELSTPSNAHQFTFDFGTDPIPAGISDLYLQVVFQGDLGAEPNAIAVGMKDLYEPTHFSFFNSTDEVFVCRTNDTTIEKCPGFFDVSEFEFPDSCPDPCGECTGTTFVCQLNNGGGWGASSLYPMPSFISASVYFHPVGEDPLAEPHAEYLHVPAGRHARLIILADNETSGKSLAVSGEQTLELTSDPYTPGDYMSLTKSYFSELQLNKCQAERIYIESKVVDFQDCATDYLHHRGLHTHAATGVAGSFNGSYAAVHRVPHRVYDIPTMEDLQNAAWPPYEEGSESEVPFQADLNDSYE